MTRAYICHTFYHAYVATMKELNKGPSHRKEATLILSTMSNDFGTMKDRAESSGVYKDVYLFEEKEDISSPEVMAYHEDKGNIVSNLLQRIKYTRMLAKLQEPFVPVDLSSYDEVYVFCDSDPIGYYLNFKKIRYHALEDGLNSGKLDNQAMLSNKGAWPLKKLMARMGLIFIESGYSRYCIDYEVNDISANYMPPDNVIECSFDSMWDKLSKEDHDLLAYIFMENIDEIKKQLESVSEHKERVMILTEPLCDFETRKRLFGDIIKEYQNNYDIIIKPHPRDLVDYKEAFPQVTVLQGRFPMEVIADIDDLKVEKLVSVITQVDNVKFAEEIVYLGLDFLDKYEDPAIHRKMEQLMNGIN